MGTPSYLEVCTQQCGCTSEKFRRVRCGALPPPPPPQPEEGRASREREGPRAGGEPEPGWAEPR